MRSSKALDFFALFLRKTVVQARCEKSMTTPFRR